MSGESSFTVHDLPKPERPRERLQKFGPEALSALKGRRLRFLIISRDQGIKVLGDIFGWKGYDYALILQRKKKAFYWITAFYIDIEWKREDMKKRFNNRL